MQLLVDNIGADESRLTDGKTSTTELGTTADICPAAHRRVFDLAPTAAVASLALYPSRPPWEMAMSDTALNLFQPSTPCVLCGHQPIDELTGLLDRATWHARAAAATSQAGYAEPTTLIMIDLDHFKHVNDRYGHHAGDAVLQAVATLLTNSVGSDAVLGRYGHHADEFTILLPQTTLTSALRLVADIQHRVRVLAVPAQTTRTTTEMISGLSVSVGVAAYPTGLTEIGVTAALLDCDTALRTAKRAGRDRICTAVTSGG